MNVGAENNGGSHTLIQSANTLNELGENVVIVDSGNPTYTWDKIKVPYIKTNNINQIKSDIIIGTGIKSIPSTNSSKIKNKYIWIRGWETWNTPEPNLVKILKESKAKKIVNSICLKNKLQQYGIESLIFRPGHNFEEIFPLNIRENNKSIILGGLHNQGKKRSKKRTNWILDCYNILKEKYNIKLWMFGSDGTPSTFLDKYFKNPDIKTKNKIYNNIDIWLSTSELEGLHIAPAEAMLTECCVCGNCSKMSGTQDYLINNETGLISSRDNFYSFLDNVEKLVKDKELRNKLGIVGREKVLSLGNRKENMLKLITFFKGDINDNNK
jgi:glycosyltransferase involved in cell wall biosynthesis